MYNVIPRFINDRFEEDANQGSFECAALFADIAGFTNITEKLMEQGKEGAEEVSELINKIYRPLINYVYRSGGFITGFAGDGFTAIFPEVEGENCTASVLEVARQIQGVFVSQRKFRNITDIGLSVAARVGVSRGQTLWNILGSGQQKTYLFTGDVIIGCVTASNNCEPGDIVLDAAALESIRNDNGNLVLRGKRKTTAKRLSRVKKNIIRQFVPDTVIHYPLSGEFRDVASVFMSISPFESSEELDGFITATLSYAGFYGSYCNGLFYDDKGLHLLMLFGAPRAYEDNVRRAVNFAVAVRNDYGELVRAGITYGVAYAGIVGSQRRGTYTVLGKTVNLAARLMNRSNPGEILITGKAADSITEYFNLDEGEDIKLKGIAEPIKINNIVTKKLDSKKQLFENKMFGRTAELARLRANCEPIFEERFAGITYVYGDAGVGKSRIAYELQKELEDKAFCFVLQSEDIYRKSFNPFVYGLKNYFEQTEQNAPEQNQRNFEDNFSRLVETLKAIEDGRIDDIVSELTRTKSFIAALLGYFEDESLYSQLEPEIRRTNTIAAIKEFCKALSLIQPLIIIQEDLHWIDEDSQGAYQALLRNIPDYPITVIAVSRYLDDSSRPKLETSEEVPIDEIVITQISEQPGKELIADRLGLAASDKLLDLINKHTEGNPFYIEQFCLYLIENNLVEEVKGTYSPIEGNIDVPEGIRSIIIARLDRLTHELRDLVQNAAVLGREFDIKVLSLMLKTGFAGDMVMEGETHAIWSALSEMLYIFKHALLQTIAYDMQLHRRLCTLHKLAGDAMEKIYKDDKTRFIEIAYHFEKAGTKNKASEYLRKAYKYSNSEYKLNETRNLLERLVKYPANEEDSSEYYYDLAIVCYNLGDWDSSGKYYEKCIQIANKGNFHKKKALYQNNYANKLSLSSKLDKATELATESLAYGKSMGDNEVISRALVSLGMFEQNKSKQEKAIELFEQGLEYTSEEEEFGFMLHLNLCLSISYWQLGQINTALEYAFEGLSLAEENNANELITQCYIRVGQIYTFSKQFSKAREYLDKALSLSQRTGIVFDVIQVTGTLGSLYSFLGEYDKSFEYLTKQAEMCEESGNIRLLAQALYNLADVNMSRGDYASAEKLIDRNLDCARKLNDVLYKGMLLYSKASIYYEKGEFDIGVELNNKALPLIESMKYPDGIFNSTLLKAKLTATSDKGKAVSDLLLMAEEYTETDYVGQINHELYKIDGNDKYRRIALERFSELYENEGQSLYYKGLIEELTN